MIYSSARGADFDSRCDINWHFLQCPPLLFNGVRAFHVPVFGTIFVLLCFFTGIDSIAALSMAFVMLSLAMSIWWWRSDVLICCLHIKYRPVCLVEIKLLSVICSYFKSFFTMSKAFSKSMKIPRVLPQFLISYTCLCYLVILVFGLVWSVFFWNQLGHYWGCCFFLMVCQSRGNQSLRDFTHGAGKWNRSVWCICFRAFPRFQ